MGCRAPRCKTTSQRTRVADPVGLSGPAMGASIAPPAYAPPMPRRILDSQECSHDRIHSDHRTVGQREEVQELLRRNGGDPEAATFQLHMVPVLELIECNVLYLVERGLLTKANSDFDYAE